MAAAATATVMKSRRSMGVLLEVRFGSEAAAVPECAEDWKLAQNYRDAPVKQLIELMNDLLPSTQ